MTETLDLRTQIRRVLGLLPQIHDPRQAEVYRQRLVALDYSLSRSQRQELSAGSQNSIASTTSAEELVQLSEEITSLLQSQQQEQQTLQKQDQQRRTFELLHQHREGQIQELESSLALQQQHIEQLEVLVKHQVVRLPLPQLLAMMGEVLSSCGDQELQEVSAELHSLYFGLKTLLERLSILPLSELEKIAGPARRIEGMAAKLRYYREMIDRAAEDEVDYWRRLRDKEVAIALNS